MINIAVIGGHKATNKYLKIAQEVGCLIAQNGWVLVCGGREGVMEAACRGAKSVGGTTVGILPSLNGEDANKYVDIKIPTGMGYARNFLVVRAAQAVVAISGEYGTLSEIAFAFNDSRPIVGIGSWKIKGMQHAKSAQEALKKVKKCLINNR
jgi:uncharacterized protein (TIGR00725 family)